MSKKSQEEEPGKLRRREGSSLTKRLEAVRYLNEISLSVAHRPQIHNQYSAHRGRACRGGIHLFKINKRRRSASIAPALDHRQNQTQARPSKSKNDRAHTRKS